MIAFTVFAFAWLFLLAVALELYARASFVRATQTNPYIRGALDGSFEGPDASLRPFSGIPAALPPELAESNARALARAAIIAERLAKDPVWSIPGVDESREAAATRRSAFPSLSGEERRRFAILHADMVFEWDAHGDIVGVYGGSALARIFHKE